MEQWKWGRLHTVEYRHPLGGRWPLNHVFNIGPLAAGGGSFQIDSMATARYEDGFRVLNGPSTRRLIDLGHGGRSWGVLPTGNVGHLYHPFYRDQVRLFLDGKYRRRWLDLEDVKRHTFLELTLEPMR